MNSLLYNRSSTEDNEKGVLNWLRSCKILLWGLRNGVISYDIKSARSTLLFTVVACGIMLLF